jgi:PKD repeat protein
MAPVISSLTVSESYGYAPFTVTVTANYSASVPNVLLNRLLDWGDSTSLDKAYSQTDSYPGDIRPGMMRIGFSDSNIGSRWQDPSGDRVGVERLYRQWADSLSVSADATEALSKFRLPWVSFKVDNWAAAATGARDGHFDSIIAGLKNLDGPVWISVEPQPEATVKTASSGSGYTLANWRSFQQRFKARLDASGAINIAFAPVLSVGTFNTVGVDPASWWIDGCWDFFGADFRVQNSFGSIATSPQNYEAYFKARRFLRDKNLVLNISNYSSNSFDATAAAIHDAFFENALGSAYDDAGARVAAVCYSSAADISTAYNSIPPIGSAVYDGLLSLLLLPTSGLLADGFGVIQDSFSITKVYNIAGQYPIRLTVTTDDGDAISVVRTVTVRGTGARPKGPRWDYPPHRPNRATFWRDSIFNTPVDELPVDPDSAAIMTSTGNYQAAQPGNLYRHMAFKPTTPQQWDLGWQVGYWSDSAPALVDYRYWIPTPAMIVGERNVKTHDSINEHLFFPALRQQGAYKSSFLLGGNYTASIGEAAGDRHAICWNENNRELFEAIGYSGSSADCENAVTWDLDSYDLPRSPYAGYPTGSRYQSAGLGEFAYGACVAEIPIAQFFFTYQDLLDCEEDKDLGHMLGFTLVNYKALDPSDAVWPARGSDGQLSEGLKAGQIIRLSASFDENDVLSGSAPARAIARTLKKYGAMLFDRGGQPKLIAPNDPSWPNNIKDQVGNAFDYSLFEVVDISSIQGEPDSHKIAIAPPPSENLPPTAVIEAAPTSGLLPVAVDFDASSSVPGDGVVTSYYWNFGDGFVDTNAVASHTYTEAGTYVVTLTITDDEGVFDIASTEIVVTAPVAPNVPPVANITGPSIGRIGETQNFSSSLSTDTDGSIVSVSWDFGDGTTSASASPSKIYTQASDVPPLPGNTPDGVVRLGATYTGVPSGINAFFKDRYENQAGKSLGIHRLSGSPNAPGVLTPAWNPADRVTAASVTTAAGRMPWFSYFPPVDRVIAGSEDANILALLTSLKNVDKPIWLSVWDNPEYYVGVEDWFTIEEWRLVQVKFRQILNQINATNISFAPIFKSTTWEGDQLGAYNPDSYLEPLAEWDFYGLIKYVTAASSGSIGTVGYPTGLTDFRQWAKTKNISHMAIADYGNNDQTVSGVNELESIYNYCLSSGTDGNGPAIMGLSLGSLYIPPFGSITLTKFNQLAGRSTSWNVSQKVQYGPYLVTLTVTDDDAETASKTQSIFISSQPPPNLPPIAIITVPPTGIAGTPVTFSSAGSSDPDGTISSYLWTFGDGSVSAQANPVYTYLSAGTYTVSLRVTDDDGATATETDSIIISPINLAPVSIISAPSSVLVNETVTLDSVSTDSDGTVVSYLWDFDDGTGSTAESPTKAWTTSGYYTVTLTVRDDDGASAVSSQRVTVISGATEGETTVDSDGAFVRPDPYRQVVLGWAEDDIETLFGASYLRAYGYPAPNALVESLEVDFGEIGSGLRAGGFGVSVISFPNGSVIPGVWSGLGEFGTDYGQGYIINALWDGLITATFTPTQKVRTDSFAIRVTPFQGSVQVPGFRLVSVAPDFSIEPIGSNPFEVDEVIGFTTFPVVTDPDPLEHSYDAAGSYIVSMTSGVDEAITVIEIVDPMVVNEPPVPVIDRVGEPVAGIPYGLIGSNSYDDDGTITAHSWDFGDGTTSDQADLSKTWSSGGTYRVVLTVYDDEGASASIVESVIVSEIVSALGCGGDYQSFVGSNLEAWNGTNIWRFVDWDEDWYTELVENNVGYQVAVPDGSPGNASLPPGSGWFEAASIDNSSFYAATQVRFPESAVSGRLKIGASLILQIDESDYGDVPAKATFALYRSNGDFLDGAKTYKSQVWSERYSFSVLDGTAVSNGQRVDISLDTGTLPLFALDYPLILVVSIDLLGTENVIPNGLEVSFFNFVGCYLTD